MRVSLNSVLEAPYTAYYQPRGYRFSDLEESIGRGALHGVLVSLNYLHMPGWNDRQQEVEALVDYVNRLDIQMIQLRTLNIDPDMYLQPCAHPGAGPALGMVEMVTRLGGGMPATGFGQSHSAQVSLWLFAGLSIVKMKQMSRPGGYNLYPWLAQPLAVITSSKS